MVNVAIRMYLIDVEWHSFLKKKIGGHRWESFYIRTVFKYIGPMYMIYNLEFIINRWQNNEIEFTHAAKKDIRQYLYDRIFIVQS